LNNHTRREEFQDVHDQIHICLPFKTANFPPMIKTGQRGALEHIEKVDLDPVHGEPGKIAGGFHHHVTVFSG
jgi:hypothetical protein